MAPFAFRVTVRFSPPIKQKAEALTHPGFFAHLHPTHTPKRAGRLPPQFSVPAHDISRSRVRKRATAWLCSWHTRDSLTSITAPISRRFMPRS
jgi:hypothetical protein